MTGRDALAALLNAARRTREAASYEGAGQPKRLHDCTNDLVLAATAADLPGLADVLGAINVAAAATTYRDADRAHFMACMAQRTDQLHVLGATLKASQNELFAAVDAMSGDARELLNAPAACRYVSPVPIGSDFGVKSCRNLRCGVVSYAAEVCPACREPS